MNMPTDFQRLWRVWRALLPYDIQIVAGPLMCAAPPLSFRERISAGMVAPKRMAELETGRFYAKQALSLLGFNNVELPVTEDRSPAWPSGTTGSITHIRRREAEGYCAVAVGRDDQFRAIGIDVEYLVALPRKTWSTFLTPRELDQVSGLGCGDQAADVLVRWCVKESVIKASRIGLDPLAIEAERTVAGGQWRLAACRDGRFGTAEGNGWHVQSAQAGGLVLAATAVRQA